MKIAICTFPFIAADELLRMVRSAQSSKHEITFYLSRHSNRQNVIDACETIQRERQTVYFPYGYNRGLGRSLNDAMLRAYADGADVVMNCNDDAIWGDGDVDRLAEAAMDQRGCYAVSAWGRHSHSQASESMTYCVIAINPLALEVIGCFDENFFPAYFEDVDYGHRAKLAGLKTGECRDTNIYHEGSFSIRVDHAIGVANNVYFQKNQNYWHSKWGMEQEYKAPWNGAFGLKIEPGSRRAPYGEYDRSDLTQEAL